MFWNAANSESGEPSWPAESRISGSREMTCLVPIRCQSGISDRRTSDCPQHEFAGRDREKCSSGGRWRDWLSDSTRLLVKTADARGWIWCWIAFLRNPIGTKPAGAAGAIPRVAAHIAAGPASWRFGPRYWIDARWLLPALPVRGNRIFALVLDVGGHTVPPVRKWTEKLVNSFVRDSWQVSIRHRELERMMPLCPWTIREQND